MGEAHVLNLTGKGKYVDLAVTEELKADVEDFLRRNEHWRSSSFEMQVNEMVTDR